MKKIVWALICLLTVACGKDSVDASFDEEMKVPVSVKVNDFTVSQTDFSGAQTRSTDITKYGDVKAITLAFFRNDGTEQYQTTQIKDSGVKDEVFGTFNLTLPMGSYTMVVIGRGYYDGDAFTLTSPTMAAYSSDHVRETFIATKEVKITTNTPQEISAELNRVVAKLCVQSTDGRVAEATKVRMTFSAGGKDVNPTTGLAITNTGLVNTVNINSGNGGVSKSVSYLFLATDEQKMDVTIETLNADGKVIFTKKVTNVPLKRNRVTTLSGKIYSADVTASSFTVSDGWLTGNEVSF